MSTRSCRLKAMRPTLRRARNARHSSSESGCTVGPVIDAMGCLLRVGLQQAEAQAELHVVRAMGEAQLLGDALLVRLDGLRTDEQLLTDLRGGLATRHQHQHVALPLAQALVLLPLVGLLGAARHLPGEGA